MTAPNRRFDLWTMLPKHNRREDASGDLRRFITCLQVVVDELLADIDRFTDIFDLERAPEPFLDFIRKDLGDPFTFDLDLQEKRRLATILVTMYKQKGTEIGIQNAIRFFLGIEVKAIDAHHESTLVLGESFLGVDWILGTKDRYMRYAFDIIVDRVLTPKERYLIREIVLYLKPAHTHLISIIEPQAVFPLDHWVLGDSALAVNTILN